MRRKEALKGISMSRIGRSQCHTEGIAKLAHTEYALRHVAKKEQFIANLPTQTQPLSGWTDKHKMGIKWGTE